MTTQHQVWRATGRSAATRPESMAAIRTQAGASLRQGEICRSTRHRWGTEQARRSITQLFAAAGGIATHGVASKPAPTEFGVGGFFFRHAHHFVWWRKLSSGDNAGGTDTPD